MNLQWSGWISVMWKTSSWTLISNGEYSSDVLPVVENWQELFKKPSEIKRHVWEVHEKVKKNSKSQEESSAYWVCPHYEFFTSEPSKLEKHFEEVHKDSMTENESLVDWVCPHCDFLTSELSPLEEHIEEVHEQVKKEKQHNCSMCEFKSLYKHNVVRHINLKHGQQPITLFDILPPPPAPL